MHTLGILIMSRSFYENLQHLDIVLNKLRKGNLVVNKEKCEFGRPKMKFLGHIILEKVVRADPEKYKVSLIYQRL